jgi:hypothetical protein
LNKDDKIGKSKKGKMEENANLYEEAFNDLVKYRTHEVPNFLDTILSCGLALYCSSTKSFTP